MEISMVNRTEESRMNYNRKAGNYEDTFEGRFTMPYNSYICNSISLKNGDSILDVACGNGRLLRMLSQKANVNCFGIDISEEMIKVASRENENMSFSVCSSNKTPFEDNKFDLITVCCAFHHFEHPHAFMIEAGRILKKGGRLLIAEPYSPPVIRQLENCLLPFVKMGDVKVYNKKELISFFEKANFGYIEMRQIEMKLFVEGIKQ